MVEQSGHIEDVLMGIFAVSMMTIALIDFRKFIIPNVLVVIAGVTGVLLSATGSSGGLGPAIAAGGGAFLLLAATRWGASLVLRKESMGIGDLKLAGVIGLFTGFVPFLIALWMASIGGSLYGSLKLRNPPAPPEVPIRRAGKSEIRDKSEIQNPKIPFGAFLALSSLVVVAFKGTILQILDSWLTLNP